MRKTSGISLILLIFLSLCLITFSLLSLSGASADEKLSQKSAEHTSAYYETISKANEILALIDQTLVYMCYTPENISADPDMIFLKIKDLIHKDSVFLALLSTNFQDVLFNCEENNDLPTLSFSVPVSTDLKQKLSVVLEFPVPKHLSDTLYNISSWKIINTADWTPDTSLNLMKTTEHLN